MNDTAREMGEKEAQKRTQFLKSAGISLFIARNAKEGGKKTFSFLPPAKSQPKRVWNNWTKPFRLHSDNSNKGNFFALLQSPLLLSTFPPLRSQGKAHRQTPLSNRKKFASKENK